ncbi:MAG: hypothetical protein LBL69_01110 [Zoogloeaceae bacterium]|nr:hypothetical protein [Zoogloeaceae bacterium]
MGLALLRALATLMGGEVGVDAENDQPGARFYFWIPLVLTSEQAG